MLVARAVAASPCAQHARITSSGLSNSESLAPSSVSIDAVPSNVESVWSSCASSAKPAPASSRWWRSRAGVSSAGVPSAAAFTRVGEGENERPACSIGAWKTAPPTESGLERLASWLVNDASAAAPSARRAASTARVGLGMSLAVASTPPMGAAAASAGSSSSRARDRDDDCALLKRARGGWGGARARARQARAPGAQASRGPYALTDEAARRCGARFAS